MFGVLGFGVHSVEVSCLRIVGPWLQSLRTYFKVVFSLRLLFSQIRALWSCVGVRRVATPSMPASHLIDLKAFRA